MTQKSPNRSTVIIKNKANGWASGFQTFQISYKVVQITWKFKAIFCSVPCCPWALWVPLTPTSHCFQVPIASQCQREGAPPSKGGWQVSALWVWQMTARSSGKILQTQAQLELAGTQLSSCGKAGSHQRSQRNCGWPNEGGEEGHLVGFPHLVGRTLQLKKKTLKTKQKHKNTYTKRKWSPSDLTN